jgi:hypothetical protein
VKELKPYRTLRGLQTAIDNGGRFYNLLAAADDKIVSRGELAKAAGVLTAGMHAILFLEMANQELSKEDHASLLLMLDAKLRRSFQKNQPQRLLPSRVEAEGVAGKSLIVSGHARFVENKSMLKGVVMIPILVGKVITMIPVPIFDLYDIYEFFDDSSTNRPSAMIATPRGKGLTHDGLIRFGGVLQAFTYTDKKIKSPKFFLQAIYYTKL